MAKMTKAQRSAAAKRAARTRKRNSSKPTRRRRTTRRRKKGLLSMPSQAESRAAFRSMASGTIGGGLYLIYEDQVDLGSGSTPEKKGAIAALGAYFLSTWGQKPNVAAGVMGAAAYDFFKEKGLLEDSAATQMKRMNYADPLSNVPIMMNDDQMYLAQGGAQGEDMYLQESGPFAEGYQPHYADTEYY